MKKSLRAIEHAITNAENYESWRAACLEYDRISGADEWKLDDASPYYDYSLISFQIK